MDNPFSNLADEELMVLYLEGESKAFEVIYSRYKNNIYTYIDKRLFDKSLRDDLFQSILLKFHNSRKLYDPKYPLLKWIYTIARSELLDLFKKHKVTFVELNENQLTTSEITTSIDLDNEKLLTDPERKAIQLKYYDDEDYKEISKILNTSQSNVRKIVSRGLKKLRIKYSGGNS